jgi:TPR repeat protein
MKHTLLAIVILVGAYANLNAYNYGTLEGNQKGCKEGNAKACNDLAGMYLTGESKYKLKEDEAKAKEFYDKSISLYKKYCDEGNAKACFDLGDKYNGMRWGIDQDYATMMQYYSKSCEYGYGFACNELGAAYKRGKGVKKDAEQSKMYYDKALVLYEKECSERMAESCKNLGMVYLLEMYGTKDTDNTSTKLFQKAFELYEADCNKDNAEGCYQIASYYLRGNPTLNIAKDEILAKELYDKSCKLGESSACNRARDIGKMLNMPQ